MDCGGLWQRWRGERGEERLCLGANKSFLIAKTFPTQNLRKPPGSWPPCLAGCQTRIWNILPKPKSLKDFLKSVAIHGWEEVGAAVEKYQQVDALLLRSKLPIEKVQMWTIENLKILISNKRKVKDLKGKVLIRRN